MRSSASSAPTPAIVTQAAARRLPRLVLLLLGLAYVLPGLLGRDPWRNADLTAFGFMASIAHGDAPWWQPAIAGILSQAPANRQTLMFSATLAREIVTLAKTYQSDALRNDGALLPPQSHCDVFSNANAKVQCMVCNAPAMKRNDPQVVVGTPEQFEALIKTEARKMESLIKGLNIQLD